VPAGVGAGVCDPGRAVGEGEGLGLGDGLGEGEGLGLGDGDGLGDGLGLGLGDGLGVTGGGVAPPEVVSVSLPVLFPPFGSLTCSMSRVTVAVLDSECAPVPVQVTLHTWDWLFGVLIARLMSPTVCALLGTRVQSPGTVKLTLKSTFAGVIGPLL
jgi:hypothetical protein